MSILEPMSTIEPIRATTSVRLDPTRAFELFTAGIETWWPLDKFSRAADDLEGQGHKVERMEFQPFVGGKVLEHLSNGLALPWGEVLVWEPPARFVVAWKPNSNANPPTELEVRFTEQSDGTLIELEHRGWERLGKIGLEAREGYGEGWSITLGRFQEAADRAVA